MLGKCRSQIRLRPGMQLLDANESYAIGEPAFRASFEQLIVDLTCADDDPLGVGGCRIGDDRTEARTCRELVERRDACLVAKERLRSQHDQRLAVRVVGATFHQGGANALRGAAMDLALDDHGIDHGNVDALTAQGVVIQQVVVGGAFDDHKLDLLRAKPLCAA